MATDYSTSLKLALMKNGEQSGTWGTVTNTNWDIIEQAVAGVVTISMANADYTLTNPTGATGEAHAAVLNVAGTNSAVRQVIAPLVPKVYLVSNNTIGGYSITVGGATGSRATVYNGMATLVYCDGTNFYSGITGSSGSFQVVGSLTVNTLTGLLKASSGLVTAATSGTDYAPPTSGASILYGNGAGGFSNVTVGTGLTFASGTLSAATSPIPSGTTMLFYQSAAPTGWTQVTTQNNKAIRVVSGAGAGSGGTSPFTTVFASRTPAGTVTVSVGNTSLTTAQLPAHTHAAAAVPQNANPQFVVNTYPPSNSSTWTQTSGAGDVQMNGGQFTASTGSGNTHTHTGGGVFAGTAMDFAVQYIDVIICTKN